MAWQAHVAEAMWTCLTVCLSNHDKFFYFTETEISSKNAKQAQYCVNSLLQAFRLFQVCLQFLIFLVSKKQLKLDLTKRNQA